MFNFWNFTFKNRTFIIILLLSICLFATISIIYYKRVIKPKIINPFEPNQEFIQKSDVSSTPILYYFYTTWCPHCKTATQEWDALQAETNDFINKNKIEFKSIDCDKDTITANKFKITGYPTIKLIYNNTIYNYDAKPDKDTLLKFLESVIT